MRSPIVEWLLQKVLLLNGVVQAAGRVYPVNPVDSRRTLPSALYGKRDGAGVGQARLPGHPPVGISPARALYSGMQSRPVARGGLLVF